MRCRRPPCPDVCDSAITNATGLAGCVSFFTCGMARMDIAALLRKKG
jgi:hypothetical protein